MEDYILYFWRILGVNSGQIQIVIGLVAFGLAVLGYFKVIHQIKLAKDQEKLAIEQRNFDLKAQAIDMLVRALESNHRHQTELYEIRELFKEQWESEDENTKKVGEAFIRAINKLIKPAEELREQLVSHINEYGSANYQGPLSSADILEFATQSMLKDLTQSQSANLVKQSMERSNTRK